MAADVFMLDLNETFPRLARPPIVEAVIHWQARAENWPAPQALNAALSQRLPEFGASISIPQVEVTASVPSDNSSSSVSKHPAGIRLKAAPIPQNPNHANVIGWPADKPAQKMKALEIVKAAVFVSK